MRSRLALVLAALAASPAVAGGLPAPGVYCPLGSGVSAISVDGAGIDLLDCQRPRLSGGRLRAARCYANGSTVVPYETDFVILPGGDLLHEGVRFRRRDREPCS